MKNNIGKILMLTSAICVACGQMFWKLGAESIILILVGFVLYGVGTLSMIIAFKYGKYSTLHPIISFSYIISIGVGFFVFGELVTITKLIGIASIMIGVIMISRDDEVEYE